MVLFFFADKLTDRSWVISERENFEANYDKNKDGYLNNEEIILWIVPNSTWVNKNILMLPPDTLIVGYHLHKGNPFCMKLSWFSSVHMVHLKSWYNNWGLSSQWAIVYFNDMGWSGPNKWSIGWLVVYGLVFRL